MAGPMYVDLGNILPTGLAISDLTGDLTVKYQILNNGVGKTSDVVVPDLALRVDLDQMYLFDPTGSRIRLP